MLCLGVFELYSRWVPLNSKSSTGFFMTAFNSVDQLQSALNGKTSNAAIATDLKTSLTLVSTTTYSEKVSRKNALSENS